MAWPIGIWLVVLGGFGSSILADDSGYVRIDLRRGPLNHLLVTAKVNGNPAEMIIDTGAACSAVASTRDWAFGFRALKDRGTLLNGKKAQVTRIDSLAVGPTLTQHLPVALIDFRANGENGLDGIIGLNLLKAARATVDCQRLRLYWKLLPNAPNVLATTLPRAGWTAIPMEEVQGHFVVRGVIGGKPARLVVDTGASVTCVLKSWTVGTGLETDARQFNTGGINYSDKRGGITTPAEITVGAFTLHNFSIAVNHSLPGPDVSVIDGILGGDVLGRNLGMVDCERNVLYLKAPGS